MKVNLISYSQPSPEFAADTGVETMVGLAAYCARVSNPSNQTNMDTAQKLINYLIKNKHWSPLEVVNVCMEITTTRDIARQILRHRSFSFQEFSQRYSDPTKDLEFVVREARLQDHKNRQNSIPMDMTNPEHRELSKLWEEKQQQVIRAAKEAYTWAVSNGIAKEQARAVLPEGNMESRLYVNGTLRSWLHYAVLRAGNGTQLEHQDIAKEVLAVLVKEFPSLSDVIDQLLAADVV